MIVNVKFCGHCRPQWDIWKFFHHLKASAKDMEFLFHARDPNVGDVLLILNACTVACCSIPVFPGPVVNLSPTKIDQLPIINKEDQLLPALLEKLASIKDELSQP